MDACDTITGDTCSPDWIATKRMKRDFAVEHKAHGTVAQEIDAVIPRRERSPAPRRVRGLMRHPADDIEPPGAALHRMQLLLY